MNNCRGGSAGAAVASGCRVSPELPLDSEHDRPPCRSGQIWSTPRYEISPVMLGLGKDSKSNVGVGHAGNACVSKGTTL